MTRRIRGGVFSFCLSGSARRLGVVLLVALLAACNAPRAFEQAAEARQLATTLQAEFAQASEASSRVVMTEARPGTSESAREAQAARERVKSTEHKLAALFGALNYQHERKLLAEFHGKFAAYEVLDTKILELAVEKSNARATALAFGPAREAADAFKEELDKLTSPDAKVRLLVLEAVLAVRELQTLEPPHIAEPSDAVMTRMEEHMAELETVARAQLEQLGKLVTPSALRSPSSNLARFIRIHGEILALSRRNTNVRSLELTLGQARQLAATCNESLRAVRSALVGRAQRPTR